MADSAPTEPAFLIVRLGALGDIVHAIPVAAALAPRVSDRTHRLARQREAPRDPRSRSGHRSAARHQRSRRRRRRHVDLAPFASCGKRRYDVAIDLQGLIKSAVLARLSGAPRVIGFPSALPARAAGAAVLHRGARSRRRRHLRSDEERARRRDQPRAARRRSGSTVGRPSFRSNTRRRTRRGASDRADGRPVRAAQSGRGVAEQALAAGPLRRGRAGAARAPRPDVGRAVGARRRVAGATRSSAASAGAAMLSPQTTIADLVALTRGAAVMVSGDTGPTHIAAAVGTPIVGIYGPTRPSRNGPWARATSPCRAQASASVTICGGAGSTTMCLLDIEVEEVLTPSVERRLAGPRVAERTWSGAGSTQRLRDRRVPLGFVLRVLVLWLARADARRRSRVAAAIALVGEALRIWAAGHLNKSREVTSSGPYRWFAHPLVRRVVDHGRRTRGRVGSSARRGGADRGLSGVDADGRDSRARRRFCAARSALDYDAYRARGIARCERRVQPGARDRQPRVSRRRGTAGRAVLLLAYRCWKATYNGCVVGGTSRSTRLHDRVRAVSSVVEHRLYTPAVTGSNPVPPSQRYSWTSW